MRVRLVSKVSTAPPLACFTASFPTDPEHGHPPGVFLAHRLETALRLVADSVEPSGNWRDCGWVVYATLDQRCFEISFASVENSSWFLSIAPSDFRSVMSLMLGRNKAAIGAGLRTLAHAVHEVLLQQQVSKLSWQLGGPPDEAAGVPSPDLLDWP